jgi:hypothetical protein
MSADRATSEDTDQYSSCVQRSEPGLSAGRMQRAVCHGLLMVSSRGARGRYRPDGKGAVTGMRT